MKTYFYYARNEADSKPFSGTIMASDITEAREKAFVECERSQTILCLVMDDLFTRLDDNLEK